MEPKKLFLNLRHSDRVAVADKFAKQRVGEAITSLGYHNGYVMDFCTEAVLNWARVARKSNEIDSLVIMVGDQRIEVDSDGRIENSGWKILEADGLCQWNAALIALL